MIRREGQLIGIAAACALAMIVTARAIAETGQNKPAGGQNAGWTLPPDAETTKNPLTVDDKVLATGKSLYRDKCQRCHGPGGLGDGPDADPDAQQDMNLTDAKRADRNPDGVVFYKIMNGRRRPKMPAFQEELTKDQAWAIVSYVQTLRRK